MRHLRLTEYQTEPDVPLSIPERDALRSIVTVQPSRGASDRFALTPGSTIGAIEMGTLSVQIAPKLSIDRVLFLVSYALDPTAWKDLQTGFEKEESIVEAIVPGFVRHVRKAFRTRLLQGYRTKEDALTTVRGRLRIEDQVRLRYGIPLPVEVRYDEFTEDVDVNRLIKAAIARLRMMQIRSPRERAALRLFDTALSTVSTVEYTPRSIPEVVWTRLNEHYRPAVQLAELILRSSSFELRRGDVRSSAFLVDMNKVFEDFVLTALRESLGLSGRTFRQGDPTLRLDRAGSVRLKPDISWWDSDRCIFVGDVKYKRVDADSVKHPDLYQLLAYVVAADLPSGLLIYAAGEGNEAIHQVVHLGRRLELATLDLAGTPADVLAQISEVAKRIKEMGGY